MDTVMESLHDLITEACGLLGRWQATGGQDLRLLTQLDLLRFELLAHAETARDGESAYDACEVVSQINDVLGRARARGRPVAKAS